MPNCGDFASILGQRTAALRKTRKCTRAFVGVAILSSLRWTGNSPEAHSPTREAFVVPDGRSIIDRDVNETPGDVAEREGSGHLGAITAGGHCWREPLGTASANSVRAAADFAFMYNRRKPLLATEGSSSRLGLSDSLTWIILAFGESGSNAASQAVIDGLRRCWPDRISHRRRNRLQKALRGPCAPPRRTSEKYLNRLRGWHLGWRRRYAGFRFLLASQVLRRKSIRIRRTA